VIIEIAGLKRKTAKSGGRASGKGGKKK